MVPIEKGLKVADGEVSGEKPIFYKTVDGFGSKNTAGNRNFKLKHEDEKVRRASAMNFDISNCIQGESKRRSELS